MGYGRVGGPVPPGRRYVIGVKDANGNVVDIELTADGKLPVAGTFSGGGDGAIVDGVSAAIRATVKNYANAKPLAVIPVDTNGDPTGGSAVSVADGADVAQGAVADAAVISDIGGTLSGKLRGLVKWAFERMPASLGQKVKAASLPVVLASDSDTLPVSGPLTDAQLRLTPVPISGTVTTGGLTDTQLRATPVPISGALTDSELRATPVPTSQADGANVNQGANADAAVTGDNAGTQSAKLRGFNKIWADVWDSINHWLKVSIQNATLAVTQSGSWSVVIGGDVAHDNPDSGNPAKVGWKAANAFPTAVANADRANGLSDLFGRQMVTHIDPAQQVWKSANYTAQQTGSTIWDPTAGKRIAITSIVIGSYGTTAGRVLLWFGDNADTTYTPGTDQLVFGGSYAPSATSKPGTVLNFSVPIFCTTADRELHITTDAALSVDVTVYGYEW